LLDRQIESPRAKSRRTLESRTKQHQKWISFSSLPTVVQCICADRRPYCPQSVSRETGGLYRARITLL